uniref:MYND-type domain-containing protein n=1 Tax=Mycena chlorophos TaxID=658473 RepID=A0ABQ0LFL1_MYCCL|nr:predicted protein [Mycena chlorophos]
MSSAPMTTTNEVPTWTYHTLNPRKRCAACAKPDARKRCTACKTARYCDMECATRNWPEHRDMCAIYKKHRLDADQAPGSRELGEFIAHWMLTFCRFGTYAAQLSQQDDNYLKTHMFFVELRSVSPAETVTEDRRFQVAAAAVMTDEAMLRLARDMSPGVEQQLISWMHMEQRTGNNLALVAHADDNWLCFASPNLDALFSGLYAYRQSGRVAEEMYAYFQERFASVVARGNPRDDWEQMLAYKRAAVYERRIATDGKAADFLDFSSTARRLGIKDSGNPRTTPAITCTTMDLHPFAIHKRFMLMYEHDLRPDTRILKTYINTTTGRPVIMILKGVVRHVRHEEKMTVRPSVRHSALLIDQKKTLLLGGFGEEYAHVCGLLQDLMDPFAETRVRPDCGQKMLNAEQKQEAFSTHRWVCTTSDGEHLIRITFNQQVIVHDYNIHAPRYPVQSDRNFKLGMTVDCFLGLQNMCYDEEVFDDGFCTRTSRWLLQAIDVVKYPTEEPLDYVYVTPRLSMIIDALPPERKGMLDVAGGRVTTPEEEDRLLPNFAAQQVTTAEEEDRLLPDFAARM